MGSQSFRQSTGKNKVKNSDQTSDTRPRRRRIPFLLRATFAGLAIALTSLWALTVSYDISREELIGFLIGSVLLLLGVLISAALLVTGIKLLGFLFSRIKRPTGDSEPD
jgi:formate/nitrite transporter FocA (FNT family)